MPADEAVRVPAGTAAVVTTSAAAAPAARSAKTLVTPTGAVIAATPVAVTSHVFAPTAMPATVIRAPAAVPVIRIAIIVGVLCRGRSRRYPMARAEVARTAPAKTARRNQGCLARTDMAISLIGWSEHSTTKCYM